MEAGTRLLGNAGPLPEESVRRTKASFHAQALLTFLRASVDILGLRAILGGWLGWDVSGRFPFLYERQCSMFIRATNYIYTNYTHQIYTVTETELAVT